MTVLVLISVSSSCLPIFLTRESLAGGLVQYRDEDGSCRTRYASPTMYSPPHHCLCVVLVSRVFLLARLRLSTYMKYVVQEECIHR